jgi:hypothetical protein
MGRSRYLGALRAFVRQGEVRADSRPLLRLDLYFTDVGVGEEDVFAADGAAGVEVFVVIHQRRFTDGTRRAARAFDGPAVVLGVPFVAGAVLFETFGVVLRAAEDGDGLGQGIGVVTELAGKKVSNAGERVGWVHRGGRKLLGGGEVAIVGVGVGAQGGAELAKVGDALNVFGLRFGFAHCWNKQGCQHRDDGDDDEKFDEGESGLIGNLHIRERLIIDGKIGEPARPDAWPSGGVGRVVRGWNF